MNNTDAIWEEKILTEPTKKDENKENSVKEDSIRNIKIDLTNKDLKDTTKKSGIYKIINKVNGKYYIGSSKDIVFRCKNHLRLLNRGCHINDHLQKAWNKYGCDNFVFEICELLPEEDLLLREQLCLDICKSNPETSYNLTYSSTAPMRFLSDLSKDKHKESLRLYWSSDSNRKKRGAYTKTYLNNPATIKKMSDSAKTAMTVDRKHSLAEFARKQLKRNKDLTIYIFHNIDGRQFSGTRSDLIRTFGLIDGNVSRLISGSRNTVSGWSLVKF